MEVAIRNRQRSISLDAGFVSEVLRGAMRLLTGKARGRGAAAVDLAGAEVSVLFVGDRRMRELNRTYRGIDRTTDVLSFSQLEGHAFPPGPLNLGDIVISPARARQQAEERGVPLEAELALLLVHGLLHLLGYDHERSTADARTMRRKERELLDALAAMGR